MKLFTVSTVVVQTEVRAWWALEKTLSLWVDVLIFESHWVLVCSPGSCPSSKTEHREHLLSLLKVPQFGCPPPVIPAGGWKHLQLQVDSHQRSIGKRCEMFIMLIYFLCLDFVPGKSDVKDGDERETKNSRKFTVYLELFNSVFSFLEI